MKFIKKKKTNEVFPLIYDIVSDDYEEIIPNTVDASFEKHVPVYEILDNKINVSVGSDYHPMDENHYIMWIALVNNNNIEIKKLKPTDEPIATFPYISGSSLYAYCNLHGLWTSNVE